MLLIIQQILKYTVHSRDETVFACFFKYAYKWNV